MITTGYLDASHINAGSITVDKLSSNVGASLDLSSNKSIRIHVENSVREVVGIPNFLLTVSNNTFSTQIYDPNTSTYSPDWSDENNPVILTPYVTLDGQEIPLTNARLSIVWYKNGARQFSYPEEQIRSGCLYIYDNVLGDAASGQIIYTCTVTYTDAATSATATRTENIEFTLLNAGEDGADGETTLTVCDLSATSHIFKYDTSLNVSPSFIVVTATLRNCTVDHWEYLNSSGTYQRYYEGQVYSTINIYPSPPSGQTNIWNGDMATLRVVSSVNGLYDDLTLVKLYDGSTGTGVTSITNLYALSNSSTIAPARDMDDLIAKYVTGEDTPDGTETWKDTPQTTTRSMPYLWNFEIILYSDDTTVSTTPGVIGTYGESGRGISSITEYYILSTSASTAPTGWNTADPTANGWTASTPPTPTASLPYLWNSEHIAYDDGTTSRMSPHLAGVYGKGIVSQETKYCRGDSATVHPSYAWTNANWTTSIPAENDSYPYLWAWTQTTFTDSSVSNVFMVTGSTKYCNITGDQVFKYGQSTTIPDNLSVVLTADCKGCTFVKWQYLSTANQVNSWTDISGATSSTYQLYYNASFFTEDTLTLKAVTNDDDVTDTYTIYKLYDSPLAFLTNENMTFSANEDGQITAAISTSTTVVGYIGAVKVLPTLGSSPALPSSPLALAVRSGCTAQTGLIIDITAAAGSTLGSTGSVSGTIEIPIATPVATTLTLNWSKVNTGASAKTCSITGDQIFQVSSAGTTTPNYITLTGTCQNVTPTYWKYKLSDGTWSSNISTGSTLTVYPDSNTYFAGSTSSATFRLLTSDANVYDDFTVVKLSEGSSPPYVFMTSDEMIFSADERGYTYEATSYTSEILGYLGTAQVLPTCGTPVISPVSARNYVTVSVAQYPSSGIGVKQIVTVSVAANSRLGSADEVTGTITIPVTYPVETSLVITFRKVNAAESGEAPKTCTITGDQIFRELSSGYSPSSITLTGTRSSNIAFDEWKYKDSSGAWQTLQQITGDNTETSITLLPSSIAFVNNLATIKLTTTYDGAQSVYDVMSIAKVSDGSGAMNVFLTNENMTFSADADGKCSSGSYSTTAKAYIGLNPVSVTFGTFTSVPAGMTLAQDSNINGQINITIANNATLGSASSTSGTITIPVTQVNNEALSSPVNLTFSWSKINTGAKGDKGDDGEDGNDGNDGADGYTVMLDNEHLTFTGDADGVVTNGTQTVRVLAYQGATPVTPVVGTVTTGINGLSVTKATDSSNHAVVLTFTKSTTSTTPNIDSVGKSYSGTISIPVTSPVSTTLKLSWSKVSTGNAGAAGAPAVNLSLSAPNGTVFSASVGVLSCTARVYRGSTDITSSLVSANSIVWSRAEGNSYYISNSSSTDSALSTVTGSTCYIYSSRVTNTGVVQCTATVDGVAYTQTITVYDKTDTTYVGSTQPASPTAGMLWLDTSTSPSVLKVYRNGSWVAVDSMQGYSSFITTLATDTGWANGTYSTVITETVLDEATDEVVSSLSSTFAQTINGFSYRLTSFDDEWKKYFEFDADTGVTIGEADSDFKLNITNNQINFLQGNNTLAYVSNSDLFISRARITDTLSIGVNNSAGEGWFDWINVTVSGKEGMALKWRDQVS